MEVDTKPLLKRLFPMYVLNWTFGMGVIEYPIGTPHPKLSFLYSTIILTLYCTGMIVVFPFITQTNIVLKTVTPTKVFFSCNILLTVGIVYLTWYRSEALHKVVAKAAIADTLLGELGIEKNYKRIFRCVLGNLFLGFSTTFIAIAVNIIIFFVDIKLPMRFLIGVVFIYPVIIMFISDTMFYGTIKCSTDKFIKLNHLLESMLQTSTYFPQHKRITSYANDSKQFFIQNFDGVTLNSYEIIKLTKLIHIRLVKTCQEANESYGLQLLISIGVAVAVITGNMYMSYILLIDEQLPRVFVLKSLFASVVWIIYYTIKIYCFACISNNCVSNSIRTGDLVNELYDEPFLNVETQNEIHDFNVQLIQNPLNFTACGFVSINCNMIHVVVVSVTTYLMILIQLKHSSNTSVYINDLNINSTMIF